MYTLKNNKLPKLHLKLHKYEIENKNDEIISYKKTIIDKDENNYGMFYFIHIFYHLKNNLSDVCVSLKKYNRDLDDWEYDWYGGDYEDKSISIIAKYDRKLLKYLKKVEEK